MWHKFLVLASLAVQLADTEVHGADGACAGLCSNLSGTCDMVHLKNVHQESQPWLQLSASGFIPASTEQNPGHKHDLGVVNCMCMCMLSHDT